jgi:MFS family permease
MNESVSARIQLPHTFRAFRCRNYRLYFFGQLISTAGIWMQRIAQQWLIYRLTGSAAMLGVINLVAVLPVLPLSLWGGSLADRFPKRSILLVTQSLMMVLAYILAALTWTGAVQVWHLLVLAMALGATSAINAPTLQAFVPEMVEDSDDLTNAIALNSTFFNVARAIGPALAGAAVATTGEAGAFFTNGITFIAVIIGLLMMRLPVKPHPAHQPSLGSHLREGIRYVWKDRVVLVLLSLVAASAFLSMPYITLLPVFASDVVGESAQPLLDLVCTGPRALFACQSPAALTYGLLMAATGLGAVIGALFVASLPNGARRGHWLTVANLCLPALVMCMALSRSFALTFALLIAIGFSFVAQNALANTLIQIHVPDALRGRVMSFFSLAVTGMTRFGGLQAGVVGDAFGAPVAVAGGALICLAYGAFIAQCFPHARKLV